MLPGSRAAPYTLAPESSRAEAIAAPRPRLAPVTSAAAPSIFMGDPLVSGRLDCEALELLHRTHFGPRVRLLSCEKSTAETLQDGALVVGLDRTRSGLQRHRTRTERFATVRTHRHGLHDAPAGCVAHLQRGSLRGGPSIAPLP